MHRILLVFTGVLICVVAIAQTKKAVVPAHKGSLGPSMALGGDSLHLTIVAVNAGNSTEAFKSTDGGGTWSSGGTLPSSSSVAMPGPCVVHQHDSLYALYAKVHRGSSFDTKALFGFRVVCV